MEDEAMQACMRIAEDIYLSNAIPRDDIRVLHGEEPLILLPYGVKTTDGATLQVLFTTTPYIYAPTHSLYKRGYMIAL